MQVEDQVFTLLALKTAYVVCILSFQHNKKKDADCNICKLEIKQRQ